MMTGQSARRTSKYVLMLFLTIGLTLSACGSDDTTSTENEGQAEDQAEDQDTSGVTTSEPESSEAEDSGVEDSEVETSDDADEVLFPDVVGVDAAQGADGTWTFNVTLSSPYDSPDRYADAWRVVDADGTVYGERILMHDHAGEQPFTRSQSGIEIPDNVSEVIVEGRDQVSGWGGETMTYALNR